ncbi:hypothetical protein FBU30_011187 [Linnemannia zychae]|nr:hypothetical protein FBU30_011187 [Linnemannia zychae]
MNHYSYPVDVYAFGVTIHRMAGGRFPEHGGLTRLSNLEVKELVDRMMHDVIDMRMKIDDVLKHSLFRMSVSEQEVAISGNKHLLDDTIENEMGTKRARRRRTYKAYERERISFSERQPGHGQSLQIINVATTVDLHHAPTLP